ncbi:MAG: PIG-L family deacetylase [Alphaproteobacteria bacterium]|nr:PIG-L family deacetylase [Alphaproteobacteria bacterium]
MTDATPRMLVIAPHPDDETLAVGGTIAGFAAAGGDVTVLTVAAHMPPLYSDAVHQQTVEEARRAHAVLGVAKSMFLDIPAVFVHEQPHHELNGKILGAIEETEPTVLLMPYPDRHVDHRVIFESVMVSARPVGTGQSIAVLAAYETLSETHWNAPHIEPNFTPNWVVDVSAHIEKKMEALTCYESQIPPFPGPRSAEAVRALAMFRGTQAGFAYGEGLQIIRMTAAPETFLPR